MKKLLYTLINIFVFSSIAMAQAPIVKPVPANRITYNSANLNALVNPNNLATTISFEYGLTKAYGSTVIVLGTSTGNIALFKTLAITGLIAGKTYHFRVKAVNSSGTAYGNDRSFIAGNGFSNSSVGRHTIVVGDDGIVYGFGYNNKGQLGDNSIVDKSRQIKVLKGAYNGTTYLGDNPNNPIISFSIGYSHTVVLAADGTVYTFGENTYGQLGDNTTIQRNIPIKVLKGIYNGTTNLGDNLSNPIISVSSGTFHSTALAADGTIYTFGQNTYGQLGDNTTNNRTLPVKVLKGTYSGTTFLGDNPNNPIVKLAGGGFHNLVLAADGLVYGFGWNVNSQLGDNSSVQRNIPVKVLKGIYTGTTFLGDNANNPIISIATGYKHSMALAADGSIYAFGDNAYGQIGDNTKTQRNTPVKVLKGAYTGTTFIGDNINNPIVAVSGGEYHSIALAADGTVYTYGYNVNGQLGDNTTNDKAIPIKVIKGHYNGAAYLGDNATNRIISVSTGYFQSIVIAADGTVYTFGFNTYGQLGDNSNSNKYTPVKVVGKEGSGVLDLIYSYDNKLATVPANRITYNEANLNALVNPSNTNTTISFEYGLTIAYGNTISIKDTLSGVTALFKTAKITGLSPGKTYHYRVKAINMNGATYGNDMIFITGSNFANSSLGKHSLSIKDNGIVYSNGYNNLGQLGDSTNINKNIPIRVLKGAYNGVRYLGDNLNNPIIAVSSGSKHSIALAADGSVYTFGENIYGQLGDNSTIQKNVPIKVLKGAYNGTIYLGDNPNNPIIQVSAGRDFSLALASDGTIYTFGQNSLGQLGDNTSATRALPVKVLKGAYSGTTFLGDNPNNPIIAATAGGDHSITLAADGTVFSFGFSTSGGIGDISSTSINLPIKAVMGAYTGTTYLGDNNNNPIISVSAGLWHSVALAFDGTVFTFGHNNYGQLGKGTTSTVNPQPSKALKGAYNGTTFLGDNLSNPIISISAGFFHTIALAADGSIYTFGYNTYGQLGDNSNTQRTTPVKVLKGAYSGTSYIGDNINNPIIAISGGEYFSIAMAIDGKVYTFGDNTFGQLGDSSTTQRITPVRSILLGGSKVLDLIFPYSTTVIALPANRITYTGAKLNTLVNPYNLNTTISFEYGLTTSYGSSALVSGAVTGNNNLFKTANINGLIPGKTYHYRSKIVNNDGTQYSGDRVFNTCSELLTGADNNIFVKDDGIVYSFGSNFYGQLGNNTTTNRLTPIKVLKGAYNGTTYLGDNPNNPIISVASSYGYSIALALDGTVYTFGNNVNGQLGDNTNTNKLIPIKVLKGAYTGTTYLGDNPNNPIIAISSGSSNIALALDGTVYTFGRNVSGTLGVNDQTDRYIPVKVLKGAYPGTTYLGDNPNNPIISLGQGHDACSVLAADGTAYTFGENFAGQLGDNTTINKLVPIHVLKGDYNGTNYLGDNYDNPIIKISASGSNTFALTADGSVYSFGSNVRGGLGINSTQNKYTPTRVLKGAYNGTTYLGDNPINPIISVVAGSHSIALAADGTVYSFGNNASGQLGDNTTTARYTPIKVLKGGYDGATFLGDNPNNPIISVMTGYEHSIALASDGTVYTFGGNLYGQLGDNTNIQRNTPVMVTGIGGSGVLDLIYPYNTMLKAVPANRITYKSVSLNALLYPNNLNTTISFEYGLTKAYGSTALVSGTVNGSSYFFKTTKINGLIPGQKYHYRAKAINKSDTIFGEDREFTTTNSFSSSSGGFHTIVLRDDGIVYASGENEHGQLGVNSNMNDSISKKVLKGAYNGITYLGDNPNNPIISVSMGGQHSIALAADGSVYTFGRNLKGALGDNTTISQSIPIKVLKGSYTGTTYLGDNPNNPIIAISAGGFSSAALALDGTVYVFGAMEGKTGSILTPEKILKGEYKGNVYLGDNSNNPIIAISSGSSHLLALAADGIVYGYGLNYFGQIGNGDITNSFISNPVKVLKGAYDGINCLGDNSNNPIIAISGGNYHSLVLAANGTVYSFGNNYHGQLGDNTNINRSLPVKVLKGANNGQTYLGDNYGIVSISAGAYHNLALASDGALFAFGENMYGSLGNNTKTDSYTPKKILKGDYDGFTYLGDSLRNQIISVFGGFGFTIALQRDGAVFAFGLNSEGQLSDNSTADKTLPTLALVNGGNSLDLINPYGSISTIVKTLPVNRILYNGANLNTLVNPFYLSTTVSFEYGLTSSYGSVIMIPNTLQGKSLLFKTIAINGLLPGKTYHYRAKAVNIRDTIYGDDMVFTTGTNFSKSTVGNHTLNIADNGIVYTIGGNSYGELGDNTKTQRRTPIKVVKGAYVGGSYLGDNVSNPIIGGSAGGDHSIVLDANGIVYTFGYNTYGQLGDGTTTNRNIPVRVLKGAYNGIAYLGDNPNNPIISVSAGVHFSLALAADGTLYSFGDNAYGQLGDSSNVIKTTPVKVVKGDYIGKSHLGDDINNPIIKISAGRDHSLLLAANGNVFSFGRNDYGELGDNSIINQFIPARVRMGAYTGNKFLGDNPLNPIVSISAGIYHSIALANNGTVYTFGWNAYGQLGDNTTTNKSVPVKVLKGAYTGTTHLGDNPNSRIVSVSAGLSHSMALDAEGTVYAFGENLYGQLGNKTNTNSSIPVRVLKGAYKGTTYLGDNSSNPGIAISVGIYHSTVLSSDGTVYSFGWNLEGQLGDNTIANRNIPIQSMGVGGSGILDLIYPYSTTVIAVPANRITYNGANLNAFVNPNNLSTAISFEYGLTIAYGSTAIVTGTSMGDTTLFKTSIITGLVPGKTYHFRAKAVNSSDTIYGSDRVFTTGSSFAKSKFSNHTIAVRDDGIVYSFGDNLQGQLGDNTSAQRTTPVKVLKGAYNGTAYLGDNPNNPIIAVSSGSAHSIALAADGTVYAFGNNTYGQLGDNTTIYKNLPVKVVKGNYNGAAYLGDNSNNPIISICAGDFHSMAVASNGNIYTFGSNSYGQLGDNSTINKISPVDVSKGDYTGIKNLGDNPNNPIISVTAGSSFSIALSADGLVYAFGSNSAGQLGDNTTIQRNIPIKVLKGAYLGRNYLGDNSINPIVSLSAGVEHVIALSADGLVYSMGKNNYGQLGDNSTTNKLLPNNVLKGSYFGNVYLGDYSNNAIVSISTGAFHSVSLAADGTVYTFGGNNKSQLGDNQNINQLVPIKVLMGAYSGNNYFGDNIDNPIIAISGGNEHSVAMAADGTFYSFGYNAYGQLGDNSTTNRSKPIQSFGAGGSGFLDLIFPYTSANFTEEFIQNQLFLIYPNPAKDKLIISNLNQKLNGSHIIIYDMVGRRMIEETLTNSTNEHSVVINELKTGAYILIIQKEGKIVRLKFVKE
jgi:alpha-tubulin suppressor-like RCC1 family protein